MASSSGDAASAPLASHLNITSPQNARVKFWVELRKNGEARREAGLFQIEGLRAVEGLFSSNSTCTVQELIVAWKELERQAPEALARAQAIAEKVRAAGGEIVEVTRDVFKKIADVETPQGIMAIAKIPTTTVADLVQSLARAKGLAIAGVAVNDPGNLGTLLRSAAAFGATALFALEGSVDPYHPKVLRSSAGNLLPVARGPWQEFRAACKKYKVHVIGIDRPAGEAATADSVSLDHLAVDLQKAVVICVGSEANGFPPQARDFDQTVAIPMHAGVESLNAGVAGSLALWHLRR